jgi:hypothetical protein
MENDLRQLVAGARQHGGIHFNPRRVRPGEEGRTVAWIMQDAAGMRRASEDAGGWPLPLSEQGGGAAWTVVIREERVTAVWWSYTAWTWEELQWHSTKQEAVNGNRQVQWAAEAGYLDIIECYDSHSAAEVQLRLSSNAPDMEEVVRDRGKILRRFPNLRIFTLADLRGAAREADALSKLQLHVAHETTGEEWALARIEERGFGRVTDAQRVFPSRVIQGE